MNYLNEFLKDPSIVISIISVIISSGVALYVMYSNRRYEKKIIEQTELDALLKELKFLYFIASGIYDRVNYFIQFKRGYDLAFLKNVSEKEQVNSDKQDKKEGEHAISYITQLKSDIEDELKKFCK